MTLRALSMALSLCALAALPARAACKLNQLVELPVTMRGLMPIVTVGINGHPAQFIVDSGAFYSLMTPTAAQAFGLRLSDAGRRSRGVGGSSELQMTTVKTFNLTSAIPVPNVEFFVSPLASGGVAGLLGENVLGMADIEYDLANGVVRIFKPQDCGDANLGYWANGAAAVLTLDHSARFTGSPYDSNRMVQAHAGLNGSRIDITFDTGAAGSLLTLAAAARAGVNPQTPGVVGAGLSGGVGSKAIPTWLAPFQSFTLGSEKIENTTLRMGPFDTGTDMLLGADFFLSHRIYVANSQGKLYLTYNGGPVFRFDKANVTALNKAASAAPAAETDATAPPADMNTPTNADGYMRRASGFIARHDYAHAAADLDQAILLEPSNAKALTLRGQLRLTMNQPVPAIADLNAAIALQPDDKDALLARGIYLLFRKDLVKAKGDLDAAAALDSIDGMTRISVAGLYERARLYDDAVRQYDVWLAQNAKAAYAPQAFGGRCLDRAILKHDLDKALDDCNAALKVNPRMPAFLIDRGLTHFARGEFDLAVADYDAAAKSQGKSTAITLYARGAAKLKKGETDAGQADIKAAVTMSPKIIDAARVLGLADGPPPAPVAPQPQLAASTKSSSPDLPDLTH